MLLYGRPPQAQYKPPTGRDGRAVRLTLHECPSAGGQSFALFAKGGHSAGGPSFALFAKGGWPILCAFCKGWGFPADANRAAKAKAPRFTRGFQVQDSVRQTPSMIDRSEALSNNFGIAHELSVVPTGLGSILGDLPRTYVPSASSGQALGYWMPPLRGWDLPGRFASSLRDLRRKKPKPRDSLGALRDTKALFAKH
jgi:hypothetical protein